MTIGTRVCQSFSAGGAANKTEIVTMTITAGVGVDSSNNVCSSGGIMATETGSVLGDMADRLMIGHRVIRVVCWAVAMAFPAVNTDIVLAPTYEACEGIIVRTAYINMAGETGYRTVGRNFPIMFHCNIDVMAVAAWLRKGWGVVKTSVVMLDNMRVNYWYNRMTSCAVSNAI